MYGSLYDDVVGEFIPGSSRKKLGSIPASIPWSIPVSRPSIVVHILEPESADV